MEYDIEKRKVFKGVRVENIYMLDLDDVTSIGTKRLMSKSGNSWLWHQCLFHVHFDLLNKIVSKDLVVGLPKLKFLKE